MLTTYARIMEQYRKRHLTSVALKQLEDRLQRPPQPAEHDTLTIPGVIIVKMLREVLRDAASDKR